MNKYVLEEYVVEGYNASSKARQDVSQIVLKAGYESFAKNDKREVNNNFQKLLMLLKIYIKLFKLDKDDILFLQTSVPALRGITIISKIKKFKTIYLIHDLFSLKYDCYDEHKKETDRDIEIINRCNYVICHNDVMMTRLKNVGCDTKLFCLEIFDYIVDTLPEERKTDFTKISVAFAGNIEKSRFLWDLDKLNSNSIDFYIYGKTDEVFHNLKYRGSFLPEELVHIIEGNYGLVWEGGFAVKEKDNYTRVNNPHKASMYLVSGLPLIVWNESAIALFVKEYGVGLCISSLDEIYDSVTSVSSEEYLKMKKNVDVIRKKLSSGYFLLEVLGKIESVCSE